MYSIPGYFGNLRIFYPKVITETPEHKKVKKCYVMLCCLLITKRVANSGAVSKTICLKSSLDRRPNN